MTILKVEKVTKQLGGLIANNQLDLVVDKGKITGFIWPNGAGKTTLFNCIAGFFCPDQGEICYDGIRIDRMKPHEICKRKLARTFQIVKILSKLTVLENVMIGAFLNNKNVRTSKKRAKEIVDFCGLSQIANEKGSGLTVGNKKRVEVARALATNPKMILFDEVMAGLNPKEGQEAIQLIHKVRDLGITILMVEHVMEIIMPISDRIIVLNLGKKIMEGTADEVSKHEEVIDAYLGVK